MVKEKQTKIGICSLSICYTRVALYHVRVNIYKSVDRTVSWISSNWKEELSVLYSWIVCLSMAKRHRDQFLLSFRFHCNLLSFTFLCNYKLTIATPCFFLFLPNVYQSPSFIAFIFDSWSIFVSLACLSVCEWYRSICGNSLAFWNR